MMSPFRVNFTALETRLARIDARALSRSLLSRAFWFNDDRELVPTLDRPPRNSSTQDVRTGTHGLRNRVQGDLADVDLRQVQNLRNDTHEDITGFLDDA